MKKSLYFIFILITQTLSAQTIVKGNVSAKNIPLEGAAIYINNSSVGTTTDSDGNFEIRIREGKYDLIVSFLGFKTISHPLNTENYSSPLIFKMQEEANMLDEIVVRNTIYNNAWKHNLERFKISFIGTSTFSKKVEILNPKALHFEFDKKTLQLEAYAKEPLKIKNSALGYLITYDLVSFRQDTEKVTYMGYTRYEDLAGSKRKKRRWKKNRLKAYYGSMTHFFRSLYTAHLKEDGFVVNQFRRVPNPNRPSEAEIKKARNIIRSHRTIILNLSKKITIPENALDSALITLQKSRLPKFQDYLYKRDVPYHQIITKKEGKTYLTFENYLSVIYKKEKEDLEYLNYHRMGKKRAPGPQTSALVITGEHPFILSTGQIINPLNVFFEGYWGFEKMAETLPLDYEPPED